MVNSWSERIFHLISSIRSEDPGAQISVTLSSEGVKCVVWTRASTEMLKGLGFNLITDSTSPYRIAEVDLKFNDSKEAQE